MLDKQEYTRLRACTPPQARTRTPRQMCNTYHFSTVTMIRERASLLRHVYIACLVSSQYSCHRFISCYVPCLMKCTCLCISACIRIPMCLFVKPNQLAYTKDHFTISARLIFFLPPLQLSLHREILILWECFSALPQSMDSTQTSLHPIVCVLPGNAVPSGWLLVKTGKF